MSRPMRIVAVVTLGLVALTAALSGCLCSTEFAAPGHGCCNGEAGLRPASPDCCTQAARNLPHQVGEVTVALATIAPLTAQVLPSEEAMDAASAPCQTVPFTATPLLALRI